MKDLRSYLCKSCAALQGEQCALTGRKVQKDADFCSLHIDAKNITICDNCHNIIIENATIFSEDDKTLMMCEECYQKLYNSCAGCTHTTCAFETDPDPMPKVVMKTIQQSGMIMQTQVPNPDRIKKFCNDSCPCFANNICMRRTCGLCDKFKRRS